MDKTKTAPKKKNQGSFKNSRLHSDKMSDYKYDKLGSVQMKATTSNPNKADRDLEKLVTKKGVFPSDPDRFADFHKKNKKGIRYNWKDAKPGRDA